MLGSWPVVGYVHFKSQVYDSGLTFCRLKQSKTRHSYIRVRPRIADGFGEDREPTLRLCTNPSTSTAS